MKSYVNSACIHAWNTFILPYLDKVHMHIYGGSLAIVIAS